MMASQAPGTMPTNTSITPQYWTRTVLKHKMNKRVVAKKKQKLLTSQVVYKRRKRKNQEWRAWTRRAKHWREGPPQIR